MADSDTHDKLYDASRYGNVALLRELLAAGVECRMSILTTTKTDMV